MNGSSGHDPFGNDEMDNEAELYRQLSTLRGRSNPRSGRSEDLRTTPLVTLAVKDAVNRDLEGFIDDEAGRASAPIFCQYAVLGFHGGHHPMIPNGEPILMNVNAPSSVFICGSQGSGKSYTLSCMLENCLSMDRRIGKVTEAVAGAAFQYDPDSAGSVAETAYLCSMGIRVNVLVSQSNEHALRAAYAKIPNAKDYLTVTPLLFRSSDLTIERMHRLMAFSSKENSVPLYMAVALRVLRKMAVDAKGAGFDYVTFKSALKRENLTKDQLGPLDLRLDLLESFLDLSEGTKRSDRSLFDLEPGTLTIVDLTDPFMDPGTACILFGICLSLFKERRSSGGLVVALDEAHKFMSNSLAATHLTDRLLGTIREQRHNATRVLIATQEPTISEKLLDLCSVSIIHRFTSPAWFTAIQNHLGAASKVDIPGSDQKTLFEQIMNLEVGESLVFAPSAYLCLGNTGSASKLGRTTINMKTRARLGNDGGMSLLVSSKVPEDTEAGGIALPAADLGQDTTLEASGTVSRGSGYASPQFLSQEQFDTTKIGYEGTKPGLDQTQAKPGRAQHIADRSKAELNQTKALLDKTKPKLDQTLAESSQIKASRDQTKAQLDQKKAKVDKLKAKLDQVKAKAKDKVAEKAKDQVQDNAKGKGKESAIAKSQPEGSKSAINLKKAKAHLALICCSCDDVVIIEFQAKFLPEFTSDDQPNMRAGIAYATCVACVLQNAPGTRHAVDDYELTQSESFAKGEFIIDDLLRTRLQAYLRKVLKYDAAIFFRKGKLRYFPSEAVQRWIRTGDLLLTTKVAAMPDGGKHADVQLSLHRDGTFFKASLNPVGGIM